MCVSPLINPGSGHGSCGPRLTYSLQVGIGVPKLLAKEVISPDEATHHALVVAEQQEGLAARRWQRYG